MESQMEIVSLQSEGQTAHALTLQLPLEGSVGKGGIKLVLRTPEQWLGCTFHGTRHDMFISLQKVPSQGFMLYKAVICSL